MRGVWKWVGLVTVCSAVMLSCGNEGEEEGEGPVVRSNTRHAQVITPVGNTTVKSGEVVKFSLAVDEYGKGEDSLMITLDKRRVYSSSKKSASHDIEIKTDTLKMGAHEIEYAFYHSKDGKEINRTVFYVMPVTQPVNYTYKVVRKLPHNNTAYTQGLEFYNGNLYEGTGREGYSVLRQVNLQTGDAIKEHKLEFEHFGEGITILNNKIYQITWRSRKGFVYDPSTFKVLGEFSYPGEGWGLTHDDTYLIMSEGSNKLIFLNPETYTVAKEIYVYDTNGAVESLNELEYVDGEIWANVYMSDRVVKINPATGAVTGYIDFTGLRDPMIPNNADYVLNGIARDANGKIFVTGKLWSWMYEVQVIPAKSS